MRIDDQDGNKSRIYVSADKDAVNNDRFFTLNTFEWKRESA